MSCYKIALSSQTKQNHQCVNCWFCFSRHSIEVSQEQSLYVLLTCSNHKFLEPLSRFVLLHTLSASTPFLFLLLTPHVKWLDLGWNLYPISICHLDVFVRLFEYDSRSVQVQLPCLLIPFLTSLKVETTSDSL